MLGGGHPQSRVLRSRSVRVHAFKCLSARGRPCTVGQSAAGDKLSGHDSNSSARMLVHVPCYEERRRGENARREESAKEEGGFGHEPAKRVEHCEHSKCNEFLFESLGLLQAKGPPRLGTPTPTPGTLARTNNRDSHHPRRDLAKSGTLESPESRNIATPPNPRTLTPPSFGIW